ncbi:MAG: hypothetical protein NC212_06385 [Staphylococcus sp.]|nr:hypothetical protein [Staphylococcus sp.]
MSTNRPHSTLTLILAVAALVAATLLAACSHTAREADAAFRRADILMDSAPDSALAIVSAIDTSALDPARVARRQLLFAKASDKSYRPYDSDSTLMPALRYYAGRRDSLETQTLFYYGYFLYEREDYEQALIQLHEAYNIAIDRGDHFYAAMSARELSIVYSGIYIMSESLSWALKAKEQFLLAGKQTHADWMDYLIADGYTWTRQYDKARSVLDAVDSVKYAHTHLWIAMLRSREQLHSVTKEYDKTLTDLLDLKLRQGGLQSYQWSKLANALYKLERYEEALCAVDSALIDRTSTRDSLYVDYNLARIYGKLGRYREGYDYAIEWGDGQTDYNESDITHPKVLLMGEYFNARAREDAASARQARKLNMALTAVAILLLLAVILGFVAYRARLRARRASEAQLMLRLTMLEKDFHANSRRSEALQTELNALFGQKFEMVDALCNAWYRHPAATPAGGENFRREVVGVLSQMQSPEMLSEIEALIDRHSDGWMSRFRDLCPDLRPWHYQLTIYLYVGFSVETISVLMSKPNLGSIYTAKSNLKKAILTAAGPEAPEILRRLNLTKGN